MSLSTQTADHSPIRPAGSLGDEHRHDRCWACGSQRAGGLQLRFTEVKDRSVEAPFDCAEFYAGYPGVVHGGVVSAVLDAAMTHCLFARGDEGMTAELKVRFRMAVAVGVAAQVRAMLVRARGQFLEVAAEFWQSGHLCAVSRGKFIRTSDGLTAAAKGNDAGAPDF